MSRSDARVRRPVSALFAALIGALLVAMLPACGDGSSASEQSGAASSIAQADTLVEYTVRGRITQLPGGAEHPAREFMVQHEEIPEFRHSMAPGDERVGMRAMTMAFPVGEGVSLEGLGVGDPIEMMFEAAYDGESGRLKGYAVRQLTPLPPETTLDLPGETPRLP